MQFRLRTLLIGLALGPPVLAWGSAIASEAFGFLKDAWNPPTNWKVRLALLSAITLACVLNVSISERPETRAAWLALVVGSMWVVGWCLVK
jgi:hypothetical protein